MDIGFVAGWFGKWRFFRYRRKRRFIVVEVTTEFGGQ
jgi:hypothetical protein